MPYIEWTWEWKIEKRGVGDVGSDFVWMEPFEWCIFGESIDISTFFEVKGYLVGVRLGGYATLDLYGVLCSPFMFNPYWSKLLNLLCGVDLPSSLGRSLDCGGGVRKTNS